MAKRLPGHSKDFVVHFEPKSPSQKKVVEAYLTNDLLFLIGPAGTGKTFAAVGVACQDLIKNPTRQLILLRPEIEAGRSLGHLPGTLEEKLDPYMAPFKQILKKITYDLPETRVSFQAVGFSRGITYDNSVVIIDECQNLSFNQLKLLMTRLGKDSKMILCGDPDQTDIKSSLPEFDVDLDAVTDALEGLEKVAVIEFPASQSFRHQLVSRILGRLSSY